MVLGSLLKIMTVLTFFYTFLQVYFRIDVLWILTSLVVIDATLYYLNKGIEKHEKKTEGKLETFGGGFEGFSENFPSRLESITPVDDKFQTHKNEVNNLIDRLARKNLQLENRMNDIKKTLGAVYGTLDDRLKVAENHLGIRKGYESEEEKELEVENQ